MALKMCVSDRMTEQGDKELAVGGQALRDRNADREPVSKTLYSPGANSGFCGPHRFPTH